MENKRNASELVVLNEYKSVISGFLADHNVDFEIQQNDEETIRITLYLLPFSSQKAFNLGIKLQQYISEYTKINIPKTE